MHPILRKANVGLALGSVVFRTVEAVMYVIAVVGLLVDPDAQPRERSCGCAERTSLEYVGGLLLACATRGDGRGVRILPGAFLDDTALLPGATDLAGSRPGYRGDLLDVDGSGAGPLQQRCGDGDVPLALRSSCRRWSSPLARSPKGFEPSVDLDLRPVRYEATDLRIPEGEAAVVETFDSPIRRCPEGIHHEHRSSEPLSRAEPGRL